MKAVVKSTAFKDLVDLFERIQSPARIILPMTATTEERVYQQIKTEVFNQIITTFRNLNVTVKQQSLTSDYKS
jgi:hypothetical protein